MKNKFKNLPTAVRKPLVLIAGTTVVLVGIALLVLPGPGWALIFLGIAILATEFAFAASVKDWGMTRFKRLIKRKR